MPFLIIFIIIPLIEVYLFISVGEKAGITATLFLCVLTAFIGAVLLRQQGLKTLLSARNATERNDFPLHELFDGICLAIAGVTLITPGFFTDAIGFMLLVPVFRTWLRRRLVSHFNIPMPGDLSSGTSGSQDYDVIETDFERVDDDENR